MERAPEMEDERWKIRDRGQFGDGVSITSTGQDRQQLAPGRLEFALALGGVESELSLGVG